MDIYPEYGKVLALKNETHPQFEVSEDGIDAQVSLQSLCDHTVSRILADEDVWEAVKRDGGNGLNHLTFVPKIGYDGSGLHPMFKQVGSNIGNDRSTLGAWFCALQLLGTDIHGNEVVYYHNALCLSASSVRPLRLWNVKETNDTIMDMQQWIDDQVKALVPKRFGDVCVVYYRIINSMVDQKVVLEVNDIGSTQRCPCCGKTHAEWILCTVDTDGYLNLNHKIFEDLQISITHFGINAWSHVIKLGIRMPFGKYRLSAKDEEAAKIREQFIKDEFSKKHGILVNYVKEGQGSSNDGNSARDGLGNAEASSKILGVPFEIIDGLDIIWGTLKAMIRMKPALVKARCDAFRELYYEKIPWGQLPPSVHKVVDHGYRFFEHVPKTMAMGMISEENLEASHKTVRNDELYHSRQFSRKERVSDVFQRKLDASDPVVLAPALADHRNRRNSTPYRPEVLAMAEIPDPIQPVEEMEIDN